MSATEVAPGHRRASLEPEHAAHAAAVEEAPAGGGLERVAHEMGHGAGMDMEAMVRDIRRRFWATLVLSIGVVLFSPMAEALLGFTLSLPPVLYLAGFGAMTFAAVSWAERPDTRHLAAGLALLLVAGLQPQALHHGITAILGLVLLATPTSGSTS